MKKRAIFILIATVFLLIAFAGCSIEGNNVFEKYRPEVSVRFVGDYSSSDGKSTKEYIAPLNKGYERRINQNAINTAAHGASYSNDGRVYFGAHIHEHTWFSNIDGRIDTAFCSVNANGRDFKQHFTAELGQDVRERDSGGLLGALGNNIVFIKTELVGTDRNNPEHNETTVSIKNAKSGSVRYTQSFSGRFGRSAMVRDNTVAFMISEKGNFLHMLRLSADGNFTHQSTPAYEFWSSDFVDIFDGNIIFANRNGIFWTEWQVKRTYGGYNMDTGTLLNDEQARLALAERDKNKKYIIEYIPDVTESGLLAGHPDYGRNNILSITKKNDGTVRSITINSLMEQSKFVRVLNDTVLTPFQDYGAGMVSAVESDKYLYIILQRSSGKDYYYAMRYEFDSNRVRYAGKFIKSARFAIIENNAFFTNAGSVIRF